MSEESFEDAHSKWVCAEFKKERQAYLKQAELLLITDLIKQSQAAQCLQTVEPGIIIHEKA